jgi:hypothetical protein
MMGLEPCLNTTTLRRDSKDCLRGKHYQEEEEEKEEKEEKESSVAKRKTR